jgi:2Fe-2S ferredoxin
MKLDIKQGMKLCIQNLNQQNITCDDTQTVLKNIQTAMIDWMQACGGKGRCTTCAMKVIEGIENLTPPTVFEQQQQTLGRLRPQERLACQCKMLGNITIEVPERLKLPHSKYSN